MDLYPTLAGLTWPVRRQPRFKNIVQEAVSGRTVRATYRQYPLYEFTCHYSFLTQSDLDLLQGFFLQHSGDGSGFWFDAGSGYNQAIDQSFGVGDGATTQYPLLRSMGTFTEPVGAIAGGAVVSASGSPVAVTLNSPIDGQITFTTAPVASAPLTWSGQYYFKCHFMQGKAEFVEFASQLHELSSVTLRSYR